MVLQLYISSKIMKLRLYQNCDKIVKMNRQFHQFAIICFSNRNSFQRCDQHSYIIIEDFEVIIFFKSLVQFLQKKSKWLQNFSKIGWENVTSKPIRKEENMLFFTQKVNIRIFKMYLESGSGWADKEWSSTNHKCNKQRPY